MNTNLTELIKRFNDEDIARIKQSVAWAELLHHDSYRASGENTFSHSERVAVILAELGMDADSIIAGLLHQAVEDNLVTVKDVEANLGHHVALLVDGTAKMAALKAKNKTIQAAETIRKMFFAMANDLRVIIIKLADKLDNMRTIKWLPETDRRRIANECVDIFAPLADRLGISWMKDELEDLSLKEINREAFDQIKLLVAAKKRERDDFLKKATDEIQNVAKAYGLDIEVMSRAKHFYSIYQKMRKYAVPSDELYDLSGVRVLCNEVQECYEMIGLIHGLWKPIDGRFKDYIAMPKANGYQSLHTTVMAYEGNLLEVQVRTKYMHHVAEFGVASHWLYKKGSTHEIIRPEDLNIINKLKDWSEMLESGSDFLSDIKQEILKDSIIVFTPKGDAIELVTGATAIDFAYAIHSDIGNHCISAKADGAIIALSAELKNTQIVEIQTSAAARPHINWLRFVKTSKARSKIRAWLVAQGEVLAIDKNIVAHKSDEKHLYKKKLDKPELVARQPDKIPSTHKSTTLDYRPYVPGEVGDSSKAGLSVSGADKVMIRFASCCKPSPGDSIAGYVSRGRGIIVHKALCKNFLSIPDLNERLVQLSWESAPGLIRRYRVTGKRVLDLFSEIESAVRKNNGRLIEGRLEENQDVLAGFFTMSWPNVEDARASERNIKNLPSILKIQRMD